MQFMSHEENRLVVVKGDHFSTLNLRIQTPFIAELNSITTMYISTITYLRRRRMCVYIKRIDMLQLNKQLYDVLCPIYIIEYMYKQVPFFMYI